MSWGGGLVRQTPSNLAFICCLFLIILYLVHKKIVEFRFHSGIISEHLKMFVAGAVINYRAKLNARCPPLPAPLGPAGRRPHPHFCTPLLLQDRGLISSRFLFLFQSRDIIKVNHVLCFLSLRIWVEILKDKSIPRFLPQACSHSPFFFSKQ